ncbi:murein hydrolase activator EnvC family protein [Microbacterium sp. ZW T6_19]|uniref:murein hydrolase activator EnvC family protein n=1 Tax=Microbacterium sp. ZW T6_19 TaxID=3378082 RepID=UPI0038519B64
MRPPPCLGILIALALLLPLAGSSSAAASTASAATHADTASREDETGDWLWPVDGPHTVVAAYRAPAHEYGAGHRGIDIAAGVGDPVRAPADGVVAFRGTVVDRPLITIDHEGGYVTTFEPLLSELSPGDAVTAGDVIGTVDVGGHSAPGTLHVGVRLHGVYINPLLLFGDVPRAVLLPCCGPI